MRNIFFAVLFAVFAFAQPSQAETRQEKLFYEVFYGGFKVAEMRLNKTEVDGKYSYTSSINSYGIVRRISRYSSVNMSAGKKLGSKFLLESYNSKWSRKEQSQEIALSYSQSGDVIKAVLTPPERVGKRPDVEQKYKVGVFDPVIAAFVTQERVREEVAKNPESRAKWSLPVFDGKRRFDMNFEIRGMKSIMLGGKQQKLLVVHVSRTPIAGFNAREVAEIKEGSGQQIDFYLDGNFVPVFARAKAEMGSATIILSKEPVAQ